MRTSSIFICLLSFIALISFQDRCQSEQTEIRDQAVLKTKGVGAILHDMMIIGADDPKAAVLYALQKRKEGHEEIEFPTYFGRQWYKKNPKEFMQWAQSLNKSDYPKANECTLDNVEKIDTAEADEFVMHQMARGPKRNQAIFTIGFKKTNLDPRLASAWAESFAKNDPGRLHAIDSVAIFWSSKDPQAAIRWVNAISDTLPSELDSLSDEYMSTATCICLNELYKTSPAVALDWALKNPNKGTRDIECYRITRKWAKANKEEPRNYIFQIKESSLRFPMLMGYIKESSDYPISEFPVIADWMMTIEKSPFAMGKSGLFTLFLSGWIDKDRAGALEWIQKTPSTSFEEGNAKGNIVASLMAGENPFTSGRFRVSDKQLSATRVPQEKKSQPGLNTPKLSDDGVMSIMKPLYIEVSGDHASNIMLSVLFALTVFNGFKIWKLVRASFIPKSVRFGVSILSVMFLLSFLFGLYPLIAKENISTEVQVIYIAAFSIVMILMTVCFWIIASQAARGSRVLLVIGLLLTLLGLVGVPVALFKSGNLPYALSCLLWGVPILLCALRRASRDYRIQARSKKTHIPKMLLFSIVGLIGFFVFYLIKDVLNLLQTNSSLALKLAWMCPLGIVLYIGPILWGLRWGDKATFNLYRFIVAGVTAVVIAGLYASFSNFSVIWMSVNIFLSLLFLTPAVFVFLPSVRNWAKNLKPAF